MSSTESRTGFRLPWSSDRSQESLPADAQVEPASERSPSESRDIAWPESELNARIGVNPTQPRPLDALDAQATVDAADQSPDSATQEPAMLDTASISPTPVAPRKPSRLMADLTAAIRATATAARDEALTKIDADVASVVAEIRAGSKDGEVTLKQASDEDIVQIRDWSKAEIARIKEQTEARIEARKALLGEEIAAHAAMIERKVGDVEAVVASYRNDMAAYSDRLATEDDPARLATMAESMPEPPELADAAPAVEAFAPETEAYAPETEAYAPEPVAVAELELEPEPVVEPEVEAVIEASAVAEAAWVDQPTDPEFTSTSTDDEPLAEAADLADVAEATEVAEVSPVTHPFGAATPWAGVDEFQTPSTADGDVQRWAAGDAPEGFPEPEEGGDPVDRGAIMAALEAAAEAVVAAEAAAESADQAEAAADVAETAAELVVGRSGSSDDLDPEAQAAFSARVDAGGFDTESFADRLASLLPGSEPAANDGTVRTTRVVVTGLISVASIASFKRHLGRIAGVDAVAVASGPEGEFVFNVTHGTDVSFRDSLPSLPGFAARVTSVADGAITVSARDPETEG